MKLFSQNKLFRVIALSRLLNSLGSYLYNIVFVVYAATQFQSSWAISIANIMMVVPTIFTLFVGIKADKTKEKAKLLIITSFVQAILFTLMALVMRDTNIVVFSIICLVNVISDILSDYNSGLRLPILQKNIATDDLMEAYSFLQFISYICALAGQAVGVWLLAASGDNFVFVALINALSFFLSGLLLFIQRKELTFEYVEDKDKQSFSQQMKEMTASMRLIFEGDNSSSFVAVLFAVLAINALGGSFGAIYNIYFLDADLFGLSYGNSLFVVNAILVVGMLLGSLTPHDYFAKLPISKIMILTSASYGVLALLNMAGVHTMVGILVLFFTAYLSGKVNPKIDSLLLAHTSPDMLARTNNFLSLLFTLSLPVGTVLFSTLAGMNLHLCWFAFLMTSLLSLYLSTRTQKKSASEEVGAN